MQYISRAVFVVASLICSMTTHASVITFDLINDDTPQILESLHLTEGDLSLSIYGWTTSFNSDGDQLEQWQPVEGNGLGIFYADLGLGLVSNDSDGVLFDGGSSGNYDTDPDEGFMLVFNQTVSLELLEFELDGSSDDININAIDLADSPFWDVSGGASDIKIPDDGIATSDLGQPFISNAFMVWVDGGNDDVALSAVSVTAVPAPASWLLFLIGALGWRATRQS